MLTEPSSPNHNPPQEMLATQRGEHRPRRTLEVPFSRISSNVRYSPGIGDIGELVISGGQVCLPSLRAREMCLPPVLSRNGCMGCDWSRGRTPTPGYARCPFSVTVSRYRGPFDGSVYVEIGYSSDVMFHSRNCSVTMSALSPSDAGGTNPSNAVIFQ